MSCLGRSSRLVHAAKTRPRKASQTRQNRRRRLLVEALEGRLLLDGTPPTVIGTTPSFAGGGTLDAGTMFLMVEFSEPVLGGDSAANYELRAMGPDSLLGTSDDLILPLTVSYAGTTATLDFAPLPESVSRLTVRDDITDGSGNALDGDGNGTPGGSSEQDFVVTPPDEWVFFVGRCVPDGKPCVPVVDRRG